MNQKCQVCGERAAGYHFGAFTCEGCKSFFGRSYNNPSISECKNNGKCIIDKKNRTTCKSCRLAKCYAVNMSKGGSRYGRRPNSFKIQYLLQEQQQQAAEAAGFGDMAAAIATVMAQQHMQCNPNLIAAQHVAGFGYSGFLPEMMHTCSPFMSVLPPTDVDLPDTDSTKASAIPFMNMINSLPIAPTAAHHNLHLPEHLMLNSGYYHPNSISPSSSSGVNTPVCYSELLKHRKSVESYVSGDSIQRYSPGMRSSAASTDDDSLYAHISQSSELCVVEDEPTASIKQHTIHTPVARRTIPERNNIENAFQQENFITVDGESTSSGSIHLKQKSTDNQTSALCDYTHNINVAYSNVNDLTGLIQDSPIDLSMKSSMFNIVSDNSVNSVGTNSDFCLNINSNNYDNDCDRDMRRKFCQFQKEQESDAMTLESRFSHDDNIKRQRHRLTPTDLINFTHNAVAASITSLRGIIAGI